MTGLHPPGKVSSERKENIAFRRFVLLLLTALAGKLPHSGSYPFKIDTGRMFQLMSLPDRANVLLAPDIAK